MQVLDAIDGFLYYPVLLLVMGAAGLYFSIRMGFVQVRMLSEAIRVMKAKPAEGNGASPFQALMIGTASCVGTGSFLKGFRIYGVIIIFVGALLPMAAAWDVADIMMGGMCLLNLIACVLLSHVAIGTYHDYVAQRKAGKDTVFRAKDIGLNPDEPDYWKD